jgi:hypothetical protein
MRECTHAAVAKRPFRCSENVVAEAVGVHAARWCASPAGPPSTETLTAEPVAPVVNTRDLSSGGDEREPKPRPGYVVLGRKPCGPAWPRHDPDDFIYFK